MVASWAVGASLIGLTVTVKSSETAAPSVSVAVTVIVAWTAPVAGPVALYRAPFGSYPEYDDGGGVAPDSTLAPNAPWTLVSANAISGLIDVPPVPLVEVIESTPAMVENCCSSTVATALAIVSGVAPGSAALTTIVGKSTVGRSLTGSSR